MGQRTPLFDLHLALGAKMVDFGGWDMPLHYGSQVEEHHQVRRDCGVFDVSHMNVIDVLGREAKAWLRRLLANDVDKLKTPGRALYSAMLDEQGGVIDDMIVYLTADGYRLVVNAATGAKDLAWMRSQLGDFDVQLLARSEMAMLAIQGPQARSRIAQLVSSARAELIRQLKRLKALTMATGSLHVPVIPAKTVWRSCCLPTKPSAFSMNWSARVFRPSVWGRVTRCALRQA